MQLLYLAKWDYNLEILPIILQSIIERCWSKFLRELVVRTHEISTNIERIAEFFVIAETLKL